MAPREAERQVKRRRYGVRLNRQLGINPLRDAMFTWLKRWVCAEQKPADKAPAIAPGELWHFVPAADPWGPKDYRPVRILDVRDGWVRYDMGGLAFRDERHTVKTFVGMYRRVET